MYIFFMKTVALLVFLFSIGSLTAQELTGTYRFENEKGLDKTLRLRESNEFIYTVETKWNQVHMKGTWSREKDRLLLTTEHQLSDYKVEGLNDGTLPDGQLKLEIRAVSAKRGPRKVHGLYVLKDQDTLCTCALSYHDIIREQQRLNQMSLEGGSHTRDSLSKIYIPQFFLCENAEGATDLLLSFDNFMLKHRLSKNGENYLMMTTAFAENEQYYYMLDEPFKIERKALLAEKQLRGRKQKPAKYKKLRK